MKRKRGRPKSSNPLIVRYEIRYTEKDAQRVTEAAEALGLKRSHFIRQIVLEKSVEVLKDTNYYQKIK